MSAFKYQCETCESVFTINYQETDCESDPSFCPFCADPLFYDEDLDIEEDE